MNGQTLRASRLRRPLILLALLVGVLLWQHRGRFPAYRHWQAGQQLEAGLEHAVNGDDPDVVRRLLDRGASVRAVDASGTPVAFGAWQPAIVAVFLERGFDVNTRAAGDTLLIEAASQGNESMVNFLLAHGADVRAQGAEALAAARASMRYEADRAGAPPPPDVTAMAWSEAVREAMARRPYEDIIAALKEAGARDGR